MALTCLSNCTTTTTTTSTMAGIAASAQSVVKSGFFDYDWTSDQLWRSWEDFAFRFGYHPWLFSLVGSALVGLTGIFPLFVISIDEAADLKHGESGKTLKILLSFAVGGLLGDVFLHILPESWANHIAANKAKNDHATMGCGLWVLAGFLVFVFVEMIFGDHVAPPIPTSKSSSSNSTSPAKLNEPDNNNYELLKNGGLAKTNVPSNGLKSDSLKANGLRQEAQTSNGLTKPENSYTNGYANGCAKSNGIKPTINGFCNQDRSVDLHDQRLCEQRPNKVAEEEKNVLDRPRHISGYLNLLANCVDNFTHGLAVGGSFMLSFRLGALTTCAILIHEIPHEIGDFAILLKSGFSRWDAAKAQVLTAGGGICGAFFAIIFSGDAVEEKTSWILPFTAGSFLHIGLVSVLPEILSETNPKESLKQISALITGIVVMGFLTMVCD